MAVLNATELAELRKLVRINWTTPVDFNRSVANASFQAMEDWYEGQRSTVSSDIDTASTPKSFSNSEKKLISAAYLGWKNKEGG